MATPAGRWVSPAKSAHGHRSTQQHKVPKEVVPLQLHRNAAARGTRRQAVASRAGHQHQPSHTTAAGANLGDHQRPLRNSTAGGTSRRVAATRPVNPHPPSYTKVAGVNRGDRQQPPRIVRNANTGWQVDGTPPVDPQLRTATTAKGVKKGCPPPASAPHHSLWYPPAGGCYQPSTSPPPVRHAGSRRHSWLTAALGAKPQRESTTL